MYPFAFAITPPVTVKYGGMFALIFREEFDPFVPEYDAPTPGALPVPPDPPAPTTIVYSEFALIGYVPNATVLNPPAPPPPPPKPAPPPPPPPTITYSAEVTPGGAVHVVVEENDSYVSIFVDPLIITMPEPPAPAKVFLPGPNAFAPPPPPPPVFAVPDIAAVFAPLAVFPLAPPPPVPPGIEAPLAPPPPPPA